jgi:hypothetical protein
MPKVYRKSNPQPRQVEVFMLELDTGEAEAMRADPNGFVRKALEGSVSHVNGVSIAIDVMAELKSGATTRGYIVHHTVSGEWESWVEIQKVK